MASINSMSNGQVCDLLAERGVAPSDIALIREGRINGSMLAEYSHDDLTSIGVKAAVRILDIVAEFSVIAVPAVQSVCLVHNNPFMPIMCVDCDIRVCCDCLADNHVSHTFQAYKSVAESMTSRLAELAAKLDASPAISQCNESLRLLEECRTNASQMVTSWHEQISELCESRREDMLITIARETTQVATEVRHRRDHAINWENGTAQLVAEATKVVRDDDTPLAERRRLIRALEDRESVMPVPKQSFEVSLQLSMENDAKALRMMAGVEVCNEIGYGKSRIAVARSTIEETHKCAFVEIYEDRVAQWRQLPPMRCARRVPTLCVVDQALYVIGGAEEIDECDSVEWITTNTNTNEDLSWRFLPSSTTYFIGAAAIYLPRTRSILVTGTSFSADHSRRCESLSVDTHDWSFMPHMKSGRSQHTMVIIPDTTDVAVIGGVHLDGTATTSCEIFNGCVWQSWDRLPFGLGECTSAVVSDRIYVVGNVSSREGCNAVVHTGLGWEALASDSVWNAGNQCSFLVAWKTPCMVRIYAGYHQDNFAADAAETTKDRRVLPMLTMKRHCLAAVSFE